MKIILASTSPYRSRILTEAGISHETCSPDVDEAAIAPSDPAARALARARAKADAVPERDAVVIAADQVLFDPETHTCFGKPADPEAHRARLLAMRGRRHELRTAYVVRRGDAVHSGVVLTHMHMRADVEPGEIDAYVASGEAAGCAGGYAVEATGGFLVERIEGDWTNVIGLPLFEVVTALRALGWRHG